ncbi:MAG TPA: FAD-dependent oxidoreductase [Pyrinomonadaceae bacterium]|nr:FAD-dependent oxidoreductase [Pyrinomonadaceae bacterium]
MAKILILGGGFGGVVAAEHLAKKLDDEHQITLVSRSRQFVFYPALVRLAFRKWEPDDVSFDLRQAMLERRVNFIEAEVARIDPFERLIKTAHGEVDGKLSYDYLIFALGRRLATDRITGFYEHAHHLLDVNNTLKFRSALDHFHEGRAVIGQAPGARLPVPVYETAFALSRMLKDRNERQAVKISIVSPNAPGIEFGDNEVAAAIRSSLDEEGIELLPDFAITRLTFGAAYNRLGQSIKSDLLMLVPPFEGSSAASYLGITNRDGYVNVDTFMKVQGVERMYAVGDCVNFTGPKLAHMAVNQASVAAANLIAEINDSEPVATYKHEIKLVIDKGSSDSLYVRKDLSVPGPAEIKQGRFWSWAKRAQKEYWQATHS